MPLLNGGGPSVSGSLKSTAFLFNILKKQALCIGLEVPRLGLVAGERSVLVGASQHPLQTPCSFSIASGHFITKPPFFSGPPLPQTGPQLELPSLRLCCHKGERQRGGNQKSMPLFLPSSASTPTGSAHGGHPSPRGPVSC